MNRFALLAVAVIAIIIAWLVFFAGPTIEPPPPVEAPTVKVEPPAPQPDPPPVAPAADAATPAVTPDEGAAAEADAEAPSGPVAIDLGTHQIMLADRDGRYLEVQLDVIAADAAAAAIIRRKRRAMIRMLFFLVSKRVADGVESAGGRQRLVDDLLPRFRNVVRSARIDGIEVGRFAIIHKAVATPDGGP